MMTFNRNILKKLDNWKSKNNRLPLILRGARQTGKTVAIEMFAKGFDQFIELNLERESDKELFEKSKSIEQLVRSIEVAKEKNINVQNTLLFIDEIQNSESAIKSLRFFHEDYPELFVIAAGSLLEAVMRKEGFSFPVGRVEFLYLYPVTFDEFLLANGREKLHRELSTVDFKEKPSEVLHKMASEEFLNYVIVGGMPAIVDNFRNTGSFASIGDIKESLIIAIKDDVAKYSKTSEGKYLRHVIEYSPLYVGERITYDKFGNSDFLSRDIKHAFELLEYAMVVQRVYGSSSVDLPIQPNFRVSPKINFLDVGLVIQKFGMTQQMLYTEELNSLFKGKIAEQIVGQGLISLDSGKKLFPCFWYRNVPGSVAETDYSYQWRGVVLPIEVKAGKSGSLKSLHQFMEMSTSKIAVQFYSGELSRQKVSGGSREFELLSIPFYLLWRMEDLLEKVA